MSPLRADQPSRPFHINLQIPFSLALSRGIIEGASRFRAENPGIQLRIDDAGSIFQLFDPCDGLIAFGEGASSKVKPGTRIPVVQVSNRNPSPLQDAVLNDDFAVGQMAGHYLADRGFTAFGFVAIDDTRFSEQRHQGFLTALRERLGQTDLQIPLCGLSQPRTFVSTSHMPVGVFAATDHAAFRLIENAVEQGVRVPEEMAVLGVDDDPFRCGISPVEISSVQLNSVAQGYQAMALLMERLRSRSRNASPIRRLIPPIGIISRRSTDTFAHSNPAVRELLRLTRDRAHEFQGVADLARACGLGTRTLERLCREHLGTSPREVLGEARFRFARTLLTQTSLPVGEIADRAGYGDVRTFIWQCRKRTGQTPMRVREQAAI